MGVLKFLWENIIEDTLPGQILKPFVDAISHKEPSEKERSLIEERKAFYSTQSEKYLIEKLGESNSLNIDTVAICSVLKEEFGMNQKKINELVSEYRKKEGGY